jgi:hypothetical protein
VDLPFGIIQIEQTVSCRSVVAAAMPLCGDVWQCRHVAMYHSAKTWRGVARRLTAIRRRSAAMWRRIAVPLCGDA